MEKKPKNLESRILYVSDLINSVYQYNGKDMADKFLKS